MDTTTLDPIAWGEFVGQQTLKTRLQVHIHAAFQETRPLEHVLLAGPPGFGKTTLARLIAKELTDPIHTLVMPVQRKILIRELARFEGGVLFLDEIHALSKRDQEILLPVMDTGFVRDERGREYDCGFMTIVAATTEPDKLIAPLHDRFAIRPDFVPYTDEELGLIVELMADRAGVDLDVNMARVLGRAAGGVPRMARQFVYAARDLTHTLHRPATAAEVLDLCSVNPDGLTALHRRYLEVLDDQNGLAGAKTIEMLLRIPTAVITNLERLLLGRGLIEYTPSGRQLTPEGMAKVTGSEGSVRYSRK